MVSIDDLLRKLNQYQRRAVLEESRATLVNANVGSGKTTVLIAKTLYEHVINLVPLQDMVVLTFTNKAADEIRDRMTAADPQAVAEEMPWFGTFHSVAMRMMQRLLPVETLGYTSSFTVLGPDEAVEMAERLIGEHGLCIKYRKKLPQRLEAYRSGRTLYGVMKHEDDIGRLHTLFAQEKIRQNTMDFDDLLHNAADLLRHVPWSPRWVIVDEFQDCDVWQMELLRAMGSGTARLFVVGDPNQIIYSWRGGGQDIFRKFIREYDAKELSLPLNYRSSGTILEAAKCFLEDSSDLEGTRERGSGIVVRNHFNPFLEGEYLADKILELHEGGVPWRETAVLYRMQRQSKSLENAFARKSIPFVVSVRKTLKDIPVLQWFCRLLNASMNQADRNSLMSVLANEQFGEGIPAAQVQGSLKNASGSELYPKIRGFPRWTAECANAAEIYDYFGLDRYLSPTSSSFMENRGLVLAFLEKMDAYLQKSEGGVLEKVANFLNSSALYGTDFFAPSGTAEDSVRLMTLHACKGLEFRCVFIIGVNYGLIPLNIPSDRGSDQEEEKRLFFVGLTRAKDYLELSYYTDPGGLRVMPGESGYLAMIPHHLLDYRDAPFSGRTDLQAYYSMILENRSKGISEDFFRIPGMKKEEEAPSTARAERSLRKVRHQKYGEGFVESEDETSYTVVFEDYGIKIFSKEFCSLEFA